MGQTHNIYCPDCNALLDKRPVEDGELIKKHCEKCKLDYVFEVKIELIVYKSE
jgi:phage FluMu protein Com